ncbi:polyprenyl synthetase family protein [Neobacillus sp. DY30]|uniref:polyprenyl synthetase family protein n=1 Tax=Neobacillus sp. DY30 TaxID=3047871 RepID=UPI0024BFC219|nr:polyprenyl synthetase family protein [Neobacillus sp. DY30]WHY01715.1 polyprenyl synthetase family protein [Neobacillus sp. DY30]
MIKTVVINEDACYAMAEKKASDYFQSLYQQVIQKSYVSTLTRDIQSWKHNHIPHHSIVNFLSRRKKKPTSFEYHSYIQWLNYTGKLDNYLDRSISYIFMRDLGKELDSKETQTRIESVVTSLSNNLTQPREKRENKNELFSMAWLYRWAQQESIELTIIWLINKLKIVAEHIPQGMDADHAQRKLIKIIAGVLLHEMEEMVDRTPPEERANRLDKAIRIGYAYGLTYPFIDDLLDSNVLSDKEKKQYSNLIRNTLITGAVPPLGGDWAKKNKSLITFIHSELREGFEYIKTQQRPENLKSFFEQSYVFFHSQEVDREKDLSNENYTNDELYIPVILKSSSSRLIVRSVISADLDEGYDNRTFFYGIYNQLADDFADMFEDMDNGAVTPYTYYLKYHKKRVDLINPFELYWSVISNLIHHVYHSDKKACEVILNRAINGLKRFKQRVGTKKYDEVMELFASKISEFNTVIQKMVNTADDVDFYDKLLRDHMITNLKNDRKEQEEFRKNIESVREQINQLLPIIKDETAPLLRDPITEAANYSLEGDGKRLRPIITWIMGINEYRLNQSSIVPLLRSLEFMHTASLIFDDLPSQDNASIRRGRSTLHMVYNNAIAELTGLFLTQKAIEEQTSLNDFDAKTVLSLVQYSAQVTAEMCKGQAMDLGSRGKVLTLEQLNMLCFYKTGIAFEASLIMPAILANATEAEMQALKKYAYHIGIAFQIKDDLLDVEGDFNTLGKSTGKDAENNNSTFVSILGVDAAKKAMWEHYCLAIETLQLVPRNTSFLKHLLNYIVNRDH